MPLKICKFFLPSKSQDIPEKAFGFHNIQFFCLSERQISECQAALGLAAQICHRTAPAGKHSAHLMVLSLLHANDRAPVRQRCQLCGQAVQAVGKHQSLCERAHVLRPCPALMFGVIALPDAVTWRKNAVGKIAVVRQQKQALGILVEPADRHDAEFSVHLRHKFHDSLRLRIVGRGQITGWLMEHNENRPAQAHRLCRTWRGVLDHPWLRAATGYCVEAIRRLEEAPHAYELMFALRFVDAVGDAVPEAPELLERLGRFVPEDGRLAVAGGSPDEALRPLDVSPDPDGASRRLLRADAVQADLERLAGEQREDGGWEVDFASYSPAAAVEWRGYATVGALTVLRDNGVL